MDEEERKRREQEKYAKEQVSVHLLLHLVRNDSIHRTDFFLCISGSQLLDQFSQQLQFVLVWSF